MKLTPEEEQQRAALADQILSADTWDECLAAESGLRKWMTAHPDDYGMLAGGEQLAMIKLAIQEEQESALKRNRTEPALSKAA